MSTNHGPNGTPAPEGNSGTMPGLVMSGPRTVELKDLPRPRLAPGHCVIRTSYVGLCGADAHFYTGDSPYLAKGLKHYPFVFGHEWSGTVDQVAPDVADYRPGDRVTGHNFVVCGTCPACRSGQRLLCARRSEIGILGDYPGAASGYFTVPASVLNPLPDCIGDREAVLLEPGSAALHAVDRTGIRRGDHVLVLGTGAIGLMILLLALDRGAIVDVAGVEEPGLDLAAALGARRTLQPADVPSAAYDVVLEASGAPSAAAQAPVAICDGGRIGMVGVTHSTVPEFPNADLVVKNATLHGVLSGIDQWVNLVAVVEKGTVPLARLIDSVHSYDDPDAAFTRLLQAGRRRPKVLLDFTGATAAPSP